MATPAFKIVDDMNREFERLFNSGQIDKMSALYTEDAKLFLPDKTSCQGRDAIHKFWQAEVTEGIKNLKLNTGNVIDAGEYLIETSCYEHNKDKGNFLVVWKKIGDKFLLHLDIFN